jgi:hypothetical protein
MCESLLAKYVSKNQNGKLKYPIELGRNDSGNTYNNNVESSLSKDSKLTLALYLAEKYLKNFESTHCIPLPREFLQLPWTEQELLDKYKY